MRTWMPALIAASVLTLAGCPSSQDPNLTNGDAGMDGDGGDAGPTCPPVPTCTTTLKFKGSAGSVTTVAPA